MAKKRKLGKRLQQRHRRTYVREWRNHRGLTQQQLADRTNISFATISRLENGVTPYSQPQIEAIAGALHCTVIDLLSRDPGVPDPNAELVEALANVPVEQRFRAAQALRTLFPPPATDKPA